jgi:hypothetical protein
VGLAVHAHVQVGTGGQTLLPVGASPSPLRIRIQAV